eukprot:RCo039705
MGEGVENGGGNGTHSSFSVPHGEGEGDDIGLRREMASAAEGELSWLAMPSRKGFRTGVTGNDSRGGATGEYGVIEGRGTGASAAAVVVAEDEEEEVAATATGPGPVDPQRL